MSSNTASPESGWLILDDEEAEAIRAAYVESALGYRRYAAARLEADEGWKRPFWSAVETWMVLSTTKMVATWTAEDWRTKLGAKNAWMRMSDVTGGEHPGLKFGTRVIEAARHLEAEHETKATWTAVALEHEDLPDNVIKVAFGR